MKFGPRAAWQVKARKPPPDEKRYGEWEKFIVLATTAASALAIGEAVMGDTPVMEWEIEGADVPVYEGEAE